MPENQSVATDLNWAFCASAAGAWADAAALEAERAAQDWLPATFPGTVAQALWRAGKFDPAAPTPLHDRDFWYRTTLAGEGEYLLDFSGLATLADIYLDAQPIARSTSMFVPVRVRVALHGTHTLHIAFRSLDAHLATIRLPRARWPAAMISRQALRGVRTTLIGHLPDWCPEIHCVGPWLGMRLIAAGEVEETRLRTRLDGATGVLEVAIRCARPLAEHWIRCAGMSAPLAATDDGWQRAELRIENVEPWWPAGMGEQTLHAVRLSSPQGERPLGRVGFRHVEIDRDADGEGFALKINGHRLFVRGAVHVPTDLLHPGGTADVLPRLRQLAAMGANMLRVAGPFCYEGDAFYRHCDELGLLVWQDLMLANMDYPFADAAFRSSLEAEIEALLGRLGGSPSLAVLCGGSEILQQAAMLGLAAERRQIPFLEEELPAICARHAPQLAVVANSPCGGDLPFRIDQGISHYFGVGAYERPLADARHAAPRFVTECLAFANVPEPVSLATLNCPAVHHPDWKTGVPRDRGASWDFEDTREHYLERLFGVNPRELRRTDPERYLAASRAVTAHIIENTLAEWRRPASPTRGALIFTAGDLRPGAGWGLIDRNGEPKSPYYAFRRIAAPLALFLSDEGGNGIAIHLANDTPHEYRLHLELRALRDGEITVCQGEGEIVIGARSSLTLPATQLLGRFFDLGYAYRFGPANHDCVVVSARPAAAPEALPLQACHFPLGPWCEPVATGLTATAAQIDGNWWLTLETRVLARFVHIDDRGYRPDDNHFHLVPGQPRCIRLHPRGSEQLAPEGLVGAINARERIAYRGDA